MSDYEFRDGSYFLKSKAETFRPLLGKRLSAVSFPREDIFELTFEGGTVLKIHGSPAEYIGTMLKISSGTVVVHKNNSKPFVDFSG